MDQTEPTGESGTPSPPSTGWAAPPPPVQAGPAGFVYADVPNRAIAYIIDGILVGIVAAIIQGIVGSGITINPTTFEVSYNFVNLVISAIIGAAIYAAYFIYTWTSMRGTIGMKALGMQIGNAGDGKTLTMDQAIRRLLAIAAPSVLAQILFPVPAIGPLVVLVAFGWYIYLLWTTYSSPTKQGFHDKFANTMVVKAARSAG